MTTAEFADRYAFLRAALDGAHGRPERRDVGEMREVLEYAEDFVSRLDDGVVGTYWRSQAELLLWIVEAAVTPDSRPT